MTTLPGYRLATTLDRSVTTHVVAEVVDDSIVRVLEHFPGDRAGAEQAVGSAHEIRAADLAAGLFGTRNVQALALVRE